MWPWVREWFGHITTTYGKCGGEDKDCSTKPPIDLMDQAFAEHDQNCYQASLLPADQVEKGKAEADAVLHAELEKINPSSLSLYGKLYRVACLIIFK